MKLIQKIMIPIFVLILIIPAFVLAQDEENIIGWKKTLVVDVTTTQTSYSDSWVGGEAGSVNWVGNLNGSAEKQFKPWFDFKSTLKLSFGQTITQDAETKKWSSPKKSTDLIDWENVGLLTLHKFVDPFTAFRLESQFMDARVPTRKLYFTPIKLTESAGISRRFYEKEDDVFSSRLGLALRQIIKTNVDTLQASLPTVDSTLTDGGIESVTDLNLTLRENLQYTAKLTLFKALFFSKSDQVKGTPSEDYWKAIDVNWENIVTAAITKIITVNFYTQLLYDKEVSKKGRFKETLGIGFVFRMF
jgi:hypothetical protein